MAIGKKFSQLTNTVTSSNIDGTEVFAVSKFFSGVLKTASVTLNVLIAYIITQVTSTWTARIYAASASNWLALDASATYRAIKVSYIADRSSKYQSGEFNVIHDGSTAKVYDVRVAIPSAVDIEIKEARINSGILEVNIKTGSSDANTTSFQYLIKDKKPVA